jgi:ATP-dependent DNA helicase RecQ
VSFAGRDRPVVVLTDDGRAVMKAERPPRLLLPARDDAPSAPRRPTAAVRDDGGRVRPRPERGIADLDPADERLFQALRTERLRLAREEGIAPFIVASDRTLRDIASLRPRTPAELAQAHGIGPHKAEKYGGPFLDVVARHRAGETGFVP